MSNALTALPGWKSSRTLAKPTSSITAITAEHHSLAMKSLEQWLNHDSHNSTARMAIPDRSSSSQASTDRHRRQSKAKGHRSRNGKALRQEQGRHYQHQPVAPAPLERSADRQDGLLLDSCATMSQILLALPKSPYSPQIIKEALELFNKDYPFNQIKNRLNKEHNLKLRSQTIKRWVSKVYPNDQRLKNHKYQYMQTPPEIISFALKSFDQGFGIKHTAERIQAKFGKKISPIGVRYIFYKFYDYDYGIDLQTKGRPSQYLKHPLLTGHETPPQVLKAALKLIDEGKGNAEITRQLRKELGYPIGNGAVGYWRERYRPETITPFFSRHMKYKPEVLAYGLHLLDNSELAFIPQITAEVNRKYPDAKVSNEGLRQFLKRMRPKLNFKQRTQRLRWKGRVCQGCKAEHSWAYRNNRNEYYEVWRKLKGEWFCFRCYARIDYALSKGKTLTQSDILRICNKK